MIALPTGTHIWIADVRDDAGSMEAPAVWFAYSPDRKSEHPANHLATFHGTLQADGFAGFNRLHETGSVVEAACWAQVRRKFHDLFEAHVSPIAREALERIAALYGIEKKESEKPVTSSDSAEWLLGPDLRSLGSKHSDRWLGQPQLSPNAIHRRLSCRWMVERAIAIRTVESQSARLDMRLLSR